MSAEPSQQLKPWTDYWVRPGEPIVPVEALVEVHASAIEGQGLYAKCDITAEYVLGPILGQLCSEPYDSRTCVDFNEEFCLEPNEEGVPVQWMNHSCDPNCGIFSVEEDGFEYVLTINAIRPIKAGEELTIDYDDGTWAFSPYSDDGSGFPAVCRCGAATCRGWMISGEEAQRQPTPPVKA